MKKTILFFLVFLCALVLKAQEPKIGSEKGVREKLMKIKKALPNLKKNLTKRDENFQDNYIVKLEMGNGIVLFEEDEEDKTQSITIRYTPSYFSGTIADYQNHYKTLVGLVKEVFGPAYESSSKESEKTIWETWFYQAGKASYDSPIRIRISCSWVLNSPAVTITFYSKQ